MTKKSKPAAREPISAEVRFYTEDDAHSAAPDLLKGEFSGKASATFWLRDVRVLNVGLGPKNKLTTEIFRRAAGTATNALRKLGIEEAQLNVHPWAAYIGPILEGALLADYVFDLFREKKAEPAPEFELYGNDDDIEASAMETLRAQLVCAAVNEARDLCNLPGNLFYPEVLADQARRIAKESGMTCRVLTEKELTAGGFGGLIAVGSGSARPPRLIILEHRGGKKTDAPIALVGKAITFDSGGISIKPAANMEEMIFDKAGGMAVLGTMRAIASLELPINVVAVIASAENMPGGNATRPGDIICHYGGKHSEVVNTDAEGRLVLADAIVYARNDLKARAVIEISTLTGACGVALGEAAAGLWSTTDDLRERLTTASATTGERVWPMPHFEEYDRAIRSEVAAVKNSGGRLGGANTANAFLRAFAGDTPFAHLDIAYMSHRTKATAWQSAGATGFGVRLLTQVIEDWCVEEAAKAR